MSVTNLEELSEYDSLEEKLVRECVGHNSQYIFKSITADLQRRGACRRGKVSGRLRPDRRISGGSCQRGHAFKPTF